MAWSYDRLWKILIDRKMNRTDLLSRANINSKTLARMGKDEPISMDALGKICATLACQIEDIIEYVHEENTTESKNKQDKA